VQPPDGGFGPGGRHGHHHTFDGGRVRRGEVRDLLLAALLEGPAHGYELMHRLEQGSGGRWRPSPGSVYPLLQLFVDQGLVEGLDVGGRRVFKLTGAGRAQADARHLRELANAGDTSPASSPGMQLRAELEQLYGAARQVAAAGQAGQLQQAIDIVRGARHAIYRLLAD
jgi:DNA-binding PadR family transcriptional regulator